MIFSYRARQRWKRLLTVLLYALAVLLLLACCLLLWLQRFIVYTPEGVQLNFDLPQISAPGSTPVKPESTRIPIEYVGEQIEDPDDPIIEPPVKERLEGYYIEPTQLQQDDHSEVYALLQTLPAGTPVMLDVVSMWGNFFYTSDLGNASNAYDIAKMDQLISYLAESDLYVIARFPALRNYHFANKYNLCGIQSKGGYVWADADSVYWLDPTKDRTMNYLIQVIKQLRGLGFDEVVLQDFTIPVSDNIAFDGDRQQILNDTAQALVAACSNDQFTVAFVAQAPTLQMPEGNSRLYLMDVPAADASDILMQMQVNDTMTDVVIIAQSYDTRYDICGILHPLSQAH